MSHFYIKPENIKNNTFFIDRLDSHHLLNVLKVKEGYFIRLFDGTGKVYTAQIENITKNGILGKIIEVHILSPQNIRLCLFNAIPKGARFDWLVEKASEIGVWKIVPIITERSNVRYVSPSKIERWNKISLAASKQSGREDILVVEPLKTFSKSLDTLSEFDISIIPWEAETKNFIPDLRQNIKDVMNIAMFIGPEGGFSDKEIEMARRYGVKSISLGTRILRTETAGILASILILYQFGIYGQHFGVKR